MHATSQGFCCDFPALKHLLLLTEPVVAPVFLLNFSLLGKCSQCDFLKKKKFLLLYQVVQKPPLSMVEKMEQVSDSGLADLH